MEVLVTILLLLKLLFGSTKYTGKIKKIQVHIYIKYLYHYTDESKSIGTAMNVTLVGLFLFHNVHFVPF